MLHRRRTASAVLASVSLAGALAVPAAAPVSAAAADPRNLKVSFRQVASGLQQPVALVGSNDGTSRIFVVERAGRIRIFANNALQAGAYLDIRDRVNDASGEQGLLGLAFHPRFKSNGYFFVAYTTSTGALRVSRFRVSSYAQSTVSPATEVGVIAAGHPSYTNHNGGQLAFNRDGYLYVSTGDGGGSGDPGNNAQDRTSLLGKILRIDVSRRCGTRNYCVPTSNPYYGASSWRQEIWAFGLRNPWRFSFDRANGYLYIGDVGQSAREEIDRSAYGAGGYNWGWSCREGSLVYNSSRCRSSMTYRGPLIQYGRDLGGTVIGGYVYRGTPYPAMSGIYVYGDFLSGRIWGYSNGVNVQVGSFPGALVSFGESSAGYLYALDYDGRIYRVVGSTR